MPKGNQKPVPIVARPPAELRDQMAALCARFDKSHTDLLCDLWRLHSENLEHAWQSECEARNEIFGTL